MPSEFFKQAALLPFVVESQADSDSEPAELSPPMLNFRDAEVVKTIEEEGLAIFTFDGLRRITGVHQETLSRALVRLEEEGLIARSPEGYYTTAKSKSLARPTLGSLSEKRVQVLHTFLPHSTSLKAIIPALKGRWFGKMRWVGISESQEGTVLKWVADDGSLLIDARFESGQLDVEARIRKDSDLPNAVLAAHQLIGRISAVYASHRPITRQSQLKASLLDTPAM